MSRAAEEPAAAGIDDCWNRIGVRGDASCPELAVHVHCRNCPVHAAAATRLLGVPLPPGHLDYWTPLVAQPRALQQADTHAALIFRVATEWLALPATLLKEITGARTVHSIPHRGGAVLGLVNVRGELRVCLSLRHILGIGAEGTAPAQAGARVLVIEGPDGGMACPVDEVFGIERYREDELGAAPATLAKAASTYTRAVLAWRDRSVGMLDPELLFHTVSRSLSSANAT